MRVNMDIYERDRYKYKYKYMRRMEDGGEWGNKYKYGNEWE